MSHSPHRRWKGHCLLCAEMNGKVRGQGVSARTKFSEMRKIGKKRRITRHEIF